MRAMMMIYPNPQFKGPPTTEMFEVMGKYNEELINAGVLLAGEGLAPASKGIRVRFGKDNKPEVSDGPFAEAKEVIGGFWILQVKSLEEAAEWARRCPLSEGDMLEIRKVAEAEDFGEAFTPEQREKEERLRGKLTPSS
jgi:hypothetical protein